MVPTVALPPATPSTAQVTAVLLLPVTVAVRAAVAPAVTLAVPGLSDTATAAGTWTVTVAEANLVLSAALVALMVWLPAADGAVYVTLPPLPVRVPTLALPPDTPSTVQATAVLLLPVTVAVRAALAPAATLTALGFSDTATGAAGVCGPVTVTVAEADLVLLKSLVAVTIWVPGVRGA